MTTQRIYSASDADMLTAAATIVENAIEKKDFLVSKRPAWADPFFPDLKARIEKAVTEILGTSNVTELRRRTLAVNGLRQKAAQKLSELKVQVKADFREDVSRSDQILTETGLMSGGNFVKFYKLNHQDFSKLLQQVKTGLTPEVRAEIEGKGTSAALIDELIENADAFFAANTAQETRKGVSKALTAKAERDKFSFKKILRLQGVSPAPQETPPAEPVM